MKHVYWPAAAADIDRAYTWYEKERKGLGEEFLAEVNVTARLVLEMPEAYPSIVRQTRRALVHRFSRNWTTPRLFPDFKSDAFLLRDRLRFYAS